MVQQEDDFSSFKLYVTIILGIVLLLLILLLSRQPQSTKELSFKVRYIENCYVANNIMLYNFRLLCAAGPSRSNYTLPEYIFEHLLDDEIGHTHLDPVRHLASNRLLYIRVLQHDAQRRGPETAGRIQEKTREHHSQFDYTYNTHRKMIKFTVINDQNIPLK